MGVVVRLWSRLLPRRRRQLLLVLVLIIVASVAEVVNIGALLPFLAALTNPNRVLSGSSVGDLLRSIGIVEGNQLLLVLSALFGVAVLLATAARMTLFWATTRITHAIGADISIEIFRRTVHQPFHLHLSRNSSEIVDAMSNKTNIATVMVAMIANLVGSMSIMFAIAVTLLIINPWITIASFAGFALIYLIIAKVTRERLRANSAIVSSGSTELIKIVQESLGGIRDIILDANQKLVVENYRQADRRWRGAVTSTTFISMTPRYLVEAIGMLLIICIAFLLTTGANGEDVVPVLGALALGAQRVLPILQQAYSAVATIRGAHGSIDDILDILDQPVPEYLEATGLRSVTFETHLRFRGVSFVYPGSTAPVLNDVNLEIARGARIGFFGTTGSGKSTLLDIAMGLLAPTEGAFSLDGHDLGPNDICAWQARIAHVPQAIFLTDGSVEENIAFGQPKEAIDHVRVVAAAQQAQIAGVIEAMVEGYQTRVGERGVRLSGGQRQRIGIARALYKRADVIIFDEATSALDTQTEDAVMSAIDGLGSDLTILMVAHRISTLRACNSIVELEYGRIKRFGTFDELFGASVVGSMGR